MFIFLYKAKLKNNKNTCFAFCIYYFVILSRDFGILVLFLM